MEKDWKVLVNEQLDMAQQCELTAQEDTPGCTHRGLKMGRECLTAFSRQFCKDVELF